MEYLTISKEVLANHHINEDGITNFKAEDSFAFEDAHVMMNPGYLTMENGWVRRHNGSLFVATLTDLGEDVNGKMFDWWFCHCEDSERYQWWHPHDHVSGTWDKSYFSVFPHERKAGHYINHRHIVEEYIGRDIQSLRIEFLDPAIIFDVSKFQENNITACLIARVHVKDVDLGMVGAGHLVHMVREVDGRSELRSRFWLGDEITYTGNSYLAPIVHFVSRFSIFRIIKAPFSFGRSLYMHCSQEMSCLRKFLPLFYQQRTKELEIFRNAMLQAHPN